MSLHYQNPIIHADFADPDVIRTGDDFWMVASTFHLVPGLPLLHSRDLIHWKIVNHIVLRLPSPEYDQPQPGKGIWAPSIRFHDGKFWVFYSLPDTGIFVTQATDPTGEWSEPYCLAAMPGWIDPCPFWDDDGKAWLVHAFAFSRCGIKNKLQLFEMAPDASRLLDSGHIIFDGTVTHPTLEGPKLYKRHGEYWIFAPAGGVKRGWQTVLRASRLKGPWQSRDVLRQGTTPVNGPHQGAWVELNNGEHGFIHFQDKGVYGRVIHLQPLQWLADGWPHIGDNVDDGTSGVPVLSCRVPLWPLSPCELQTSDTFSEGKPGLQWQWQANPCHDWIAPGKQGLRLNCVPTDSAIALYNLPQLLLQPFPAERFTVKTTLSLDALQESDESGLAVYGQRFAALRVYKARTEMTLSLLHGWINDRGELTTTVLTQENLGYLQCITLGLRVAHDGIVHFGYQLAGQGWQKMGPQVSAGAGKWIGARMGIYARGAAVQAGGQALFSDFTVTV